MFSIDIINKTKIEDLIIIGIFFHNHSFVPSDKTSFAKITLTDYSTKVFFNLKTNSFIIFISL